MDKTLIYIAMLSLAFSITFAGCSGTRPADLGVKNGKLLPCPDTPNCISSQSTDREHAIVPLAYTGPPADAIRNLKKIILSMKRTKIVEESDRYLYAEFTSAIFRFVDDVEFFIDDNAKLIHVRSASRLGKSDLGVNRKRVEKIRAAWEALQRSK